MMARIMALRKTEFIAKIIPHLTGTQIHPGGFPVIALIKGCLVMPGSLFFLDSPARV
jgi:hypothetical protein